METSLRVLVIEDDDDVAELLTLQLEFGLGATVTRASDGETGLALLCTDAFDVAVLDVVLAGVSGTTIIDRLRRHDHRTPVVVVTRVAQSHRIEATRLGAYAVLAEPYRRRDLLTVVQDAAGTRALA